MNAGEGVLIFITVDNLEMTKTVENKLVMAKCQAVKGLVCVLH